MFQTNIFGVRKHWNLCADYDIRCTKLFEVCSSKMEVISLEQSKIEEIICKLDSNHPLKNVGNTEYLNTLIEKLAILQNLKKIKLKTLLCGNEPYSKYKYNQGVAELMLYILFSQEKLPFTSEVTQNSGNNSNVDIVLKHKGISFNFEVKSPEYAEFEEGVLSGGYANRFGDKQSNAFMLSEFNDMLAPNIGKAGYREIKETPLSDNKVKDCLLSAQQKFSTPSETNFNILFICTTTAEMVMYWNYIVNEQSGFFNPVSDISSFLSTNKQPLNRNDFNRVNAIILSNAITLNERRDANAWDIAKAINIVLSNPFAECNSFGKFQILSEIFPHKTCEFVKMIFDERVKHPDIPELCHAYTFVSENGYNINQEKTKRGENR